MACLKEIDPDIEVTPEMIEAGVCALASFNDRLESDDEAVVRIFRAMDRARVKGVWGSARS